MNDAIAAQLDATDKVVWRLHKMCCDPDRSPRMQAIEEELRVVRSELEAGVDEASGPAILAQLEDIGGRLGTLQVLCCTAARMPLYADALERLTAIQIEVNTELGLAH